jgi:hypothetical protein
MRLVGFAMRRLPRKSTYIAQEYDAKARGMQSPPAVPDQEPTAQERALAILREFEKARKALVGRAVVSSDGKFGTAQDVQLDDLHGLRVIIAGHDGAWPISTVKFADES